MADRISCRVCIGSCHATVRLNERRIKAGRPPFRHGGSPVLAMSAVPRSRCACATVGWKRSAVRYSSIAIRITQRKSVLPKVSRGSLSIRFDMQRLPGPRGISSGVERRLNRRRTGGGGGGAEVCWQRSRGSLLEGLGQPAEQRCFGDDGVSARTVPCCRGGRRSSFWHRPAGDGRGTATVAMRTTVRRRRVART